MAAKTDYGPILKMFRTLNRTCRGRSFLWVADGHAGITRNHPRLG
jgi:hypothetical protein